MGNAALRKVASLEERPLSDFSGQTVAIDAHHFIYKYVNVMKRWADPDDYTTEQGQEVPNIHAFLQGIPSLLDHNLTPVFVFDGEPHDLKSEEIEQRKEAKKQAEKQLKNAKSRGDTEAIKRYRAQTTELTDAIHESSRGLLDRLGIPYVEANGAGEAQAAHMVKQGIVDAAMTDDYDALLFGSDLTIRQYSGSGPAELMSLSDTIENTGLTHSQIVDLAILCGTDYNEGISGIGPKRGQKYLSNGQRAEDVLAERDASVPDLDAIRSLFLDPPVAETSSDFSVDTPNIEAAESYTIDQWEVAPGLINDELDRLRTHIPTP
jgi:flap endonuclease-1